MTDATKAKRKADRSGSRLLLSLTGRLERYMARAGLIAFAVDAAAPAPAPAPMLVDDAAAAAPAPAAPAPSPAPAAPAPSPAPTPAPTAAPAAAPKADGEGEGEKKDGDEKPGAPEKYADFKLPEGMKADDAHMGKFAEWAKTNNLTQEAAQSAVDMMANVQKDGLQQLQTHIQDTAKAWHDASLVDKEFGGDKYAENLAIAKRGMEQFATPELKSFLKESHIQAHPEVLRFFYRVGKATSEDGFVPGRAGSGDKSIAQRMYPNMNP